MKTAKWSIGLRGFLGIAGIGLVVLLPLAVFAPALGAMALAVTALAAAFVQHRRATALAASHEKLSGEIDVLSQHLLKVEALASAAAARARPAPPSIAAPSAEIETIATGLEEVTGEIGLLSGIVRELAAVVAAQDGEIARLKAKPREAQAPSTPEPAPAQVPAQVPATPARPVPPAPRETPPQRASLPAPSPPPAGQPSPGQPPRDAAREAALIEAFDGGGLEVWLQPLVTLPQRKVVSYEAVARLRLGQGETAEVLAPDAFLPVLERHGRTTALDRRMLKGAATIARHLQGRGSPAAVAYGLSPLSLFEPDFLRSLGGLIGTDLSGRLAVALPQASWRSLDPEQRTALAELRGRVGFLLDRPTDLRFEAAALAERGIEQVSVPAGLLLRPPPEARPDIAVEDLVAALGRAGIRLAACGVEAETDVPDLIDLDVPLAQGTVFASPRAVRSEVLTSAPASAAEPPSEPDPDPPPQRRAFRDFLRRAV